MESVQCRTGKQHPVRSLHGQLSEADVVSVVGTFGPFSGAFAALKVDGSVVAWGDPEHLGYKLAE